MNRVLPVECAPPKIGEATAATDLHILPADLHEPWHLQVLVVEDTATDFHWISQHLAALEEYDVGITRAQTVAEAETVVANGRFDVALVDYQLPDGLGDRVVASIALTNPACATIMVSGHAMAEVSLFAARSGAVAAIAKDDLNPGLLETTIRFALQNQAIRCALIERSGI